MNWIEPKTNWTIRLDQEGNYLGDYMDIEDYRRISNNLSCLNKMAEELYILKKPVEIGLVSREDFCTAESINVLEESVERLRIGALANLVEKTKHWKADQPAPVAADWNRIEKSCLVLWQTLNRQKQSARRLPLRLGGGIW